MVDGAKRLRRYLRKAGITQSAFAEQADVPGPQVSMWLSGRRRPGLSSALKLDRATGGAVPVTAWTLNDKQSSKPAA